MNYWKISFLIGFLMIMVSSAHAQLFPPPAKKKTTDSSAKSQFILKALLTEVGANYEIKKTPIPSKKEKQKAQKKKC